MLNERNASALKKIQIFSEHLISFNESQISSLWKDEYNSNIAVMDHHHKMLFSLIHRFENRNMSQNTTKTILQEMRAYTEFHFTHEEALFKKWGIKDHKHSHEGFLNKLVDFEKRSDLGDPNVGHEAHTFLKKWFVNHILKEDMKGAKQILRKMTSVELCMEVERCRASPTLSNLIDQCFDVIDADMNGKIDIQEMGRFFEMLGIKLTTKEIQDFVAVFDLNNDGEIDLVEFKKMLL